MEREKKDLFNVALGISATIHAPTSLSGSNVNPVCCEITGTGKQLRIDEGFE
jgi:hypothetical protein